MKLKRVFLTIFSVMCIFAITFSCAVAAESFYTSKSALVSENFESGRIADSVFDPRLGDVRYSLVYDNDRKINGKFSAVSPQGISNYNIFMASDSSRLVLGSQKTYSVIFRIKVIESFTNNGNFYIETRANDNNFRYWRFHSDGSEWECGAKGADDGSWRDWYLYDKTTSYVDYINDYYLIKFTFTTSSAGYSIKFGVNCDGGKGQVAIDDIMVFEGSRTAKPQKAVKEDYATEENTIYTESVMID